MEDSPLIDKTNPHMCPYIKENAKINDYITHPKYWDINPLIKYSFKPYH